MFKRQLHDDEHAAELSEAELARMALPASWCRLPSLPRGCRRLFGEDNMTPPATGDGVDRKTVTLCQSRHNLSRGRCPIISKPAALFTPSSTTHRSLLLPRTSDHAGGTSERDGSHGLHLQGCSRPVRCCIDASSLRKSWAMRTTSSSMHAKNICKAMHLRICMWIIPRCNQDASKGTSEGRGLPRLQRLQRLRRLWSNNATSLSQPAATDTRLLEVSNTTDVAIDGVMLEELLQCC